MDVNVTMVVLAVQAGVLLGVVWWAGRRAANGAAAAVPAAIDATLQGIGDDRVRAVADELVQMNEALDQTRTTLGQMREEDARLAKRAVTEAYGSMFIGVACGAVSGSAIAAVPPDLASVPEWFWSALEERALSGLLVIVASGLLSAASIWAMGRWIDKRHR